MVSLARDYPGKKNILANQLSHPDQVIPTEWSLLLLGFDKCLQCVLPSSHQSVCHKGKFQVAHSHVYSCRSHNVEAGCLPASVDDLKCLHIPSIYSSRSIFKISCISEPLHDPFHSIMATEGVLYFRFHFFFFFFFFFFCITLVCFVEMYC